MKRLYKKNPDEEHNFWMSYTDLMSGFLIVFIIITTILYVNYRKEQEQTRILNEALKEANLDKGKMVDLIAEYRKNDLRNVVDRYKETLPSTPSIHVQVDTSRGSIILTHVRPQGYVDDENKYELFPSGKAYMTDDLKAYIVKYGADIVRKTIEISTERKRDVELRIEGHTDPTWTDGYRDITGSDESFIKNLTLSSERANSVYRCIFYDTGLTDDELLFVKKNMISVGYSFSRRLIEGTELTRNSSLDDESRRIEFRIIAK